MHFDFDFRCRNCGSLLHAQHQWVGREAACNCCKLRFIIKPPVVDKVALASPEFSGQQLAVISNDSAKTRNGRSAQSVSRQCVPQAEKEGQSVPIQFLRVEKTEPVAVPLSPTARSTPPVVNGAPAFALARAAPSHLPQRKMPAMSLTWMMLVGCLFGATFGFLLRPSFLGEKLALHHVVTCGATLDGLDRLLVPLAERSFAYMLIGTVVGFVVSFMIAMNIGPRSRPSFLEVPGRY